MPIHSKGENGDCQYALNIYLVNNATIVGDATIVQFIDCAIQFTIQQIFGFRGECRSMQQLTLIVCIFY
jgi:hypothetical protein